MFQISPPEAPFARRAASLTFSAHQAALTDENPLRENFSDFFTPGPRPNPLTLSKCAERHPNAANGAENGTEFLSKIL